MSVKKCIRISISFLILYCFNTLYSQELTKEIDPLPLYRPGFSLKAYGSIHGFANIPQVKSFGTGGGIAGSLYVGTVEIETGLGYFTRFDRFSVGLGGSNHNPISYPFSQINHTQHILKAHIVVNVKIVQLKKHIFSGFAGLDFTKSVGWTVDTIYKNGTHLFVDNVYTQADRGVGVNMKGGLRYTLMCTRKFHFFSDFFFGAVVNREYHNRNGMTTVDTKPPEGGLFAGLSIGVQWLFSKQVPRFFAPE